MDGLTHALASMAGKAIDPLFLFFAVIGIALAVRGWWVESFAVFGVGAIINAAMLWLWWQSIGVDPVQQTNWLIVTWYLWWGPFSLIALLVRRIDPW
jgi:hypothetical protein